MLLGAVLLSLIGLTACSPADLLGTGPKVGSELGGSFVEAVVGPVATLNPLFALDDNSRDLSGLVFEGLIGLDDNQQPVPNLAEGWTVSENDRRIYTVNLKVGINWADGSPLTADDVLFTYQLLSDPRYEQPDAQFWRGVQVERLTQYQVRFTLRSPSASFPLALRAGILPAHAFADHNPQAVAKDPHSTSRAFGTGPFMVESFQRDRVVLRRNPTARARAQLSQMTFVSYPSAADAANAVLTGRADAVGGLQPNQLAAFQQHSNITVYESRSYLLGALFFNVGPNAAPILQDLAVRRAISQAINRQKLIDEALNGHADPSPSAEPASLWAYAPEIAERYPYNPEQAAATLEAAGWKAAGPGQTRVRAGIPLRISLVVADTYPYDRLGQLIAQQLAPVGIQVDVESTNAAVLIGTYLRGKRFQMLLAVFDNGPDPDQYTLWHSGQKSDFSFGGSLPRQPLIDKDLEDGRFQIDRAARRLAYQNLQSDLADAVPAAFIYEPRYEYAVARRVEGVGLPGAVQSRDRFWTVTQWRIGTNRL